MARTASAETIADKDRQPQFRRAVQLIRGGIEDVKSRIGTLNEKIGEHWGTIEGFKCNKVGAKIFAKLDKLEPDDRVDAWRTIIGMREASDWPEMRDMVDDMQAPADPPADDKTPTPVSTTKDLAAVKPGKKLTPAQAAAEAKRHLSVVPSEKKSDAPIDPSVDKDLAGE